MVDKEIYNLFKRGSRTYFYSSIFFPASIRNNVFILYSFVRKADNYVDSIPQNSEGFYAFKRKFEKCYSGEAVDDIVVTSFVNLMKISSFQYEWVSSFLKSMEMDLTKRGYSDIAEVSEYIHGSAEVIGLFMSKLLRLNEESYKYAMGLGKAMQYINFIRDINEDIGLHRTYIPKEILRKHGIDKFDYDYILLHKDEFTSMIREEIERYRSWQSYGEAGFKYIPKLFLIPIKTASDMYKYTADKIYKNPFIIYEKKVKPSVFRIMISSIKNIFEIL